MNMKKTMDFLRVSATVCREGANLIAMYSSFDDLYMIQEHRDYIERFFDEAFACGKITSAVRDLWGYRNATAYTHRANELFYVEQKKGGGNV